MTLEQKITNCLLDNPKFKIESLTIWIAITKKRFLWEYHSGLVTKYCPEYLDLNKYNWKKYSWAIIQYCPEHFDTNKYHWKTHTWAVIKYCPEKLDTSKANLKNILQIFPQYKNMSLEEIKQKAILNKL